MTCASIIGIFMLKWKYYPYGEYRMKLYSRGQVLFFSLLSALIVLLFAAGLGFFKPLLPVKIENVNLQPQEWPEAEFKLLQSEHLAIDTQSLVHCALPVPEHRMETHIVDERLEKPIVGKLAPYIVDFIAYKRSVGQKADTQLKLLRSFAVFSLGYDLSDCLLPEALVKD